MYKRKLISLDFHQPEKFNIEDESQFRNLILWLEDQKIRHYKIEDRAPLREIAVAEWLKYYEKYLLDLSCPYKPPQRHQVVDWLLGYAVRLEYGDNVDKYRNMSGEDVVKNTSQRKAAAPSSNPLDALDFNDPDFKAGVTSLAMLLQIPPHPDHLEQLKAICLLVKNKLSKEALEKPPQFDKKDFIPLEKQDLGFDAGDYILNDASKILRLLYIKDLRHMQTQINAAIVAVQALIANPKTDSRLGKVGR